MHVVRQQSNSKSVHNISGEASTTITDINPATYNKKLNENPESYFICTQIIITYEEKTIT